jgi:hypothetical protein
MEPLGTIEPSGDVAAGGRLEWIRLIEVYPQLSPVPPREGINPFTKGPHLYRARPDTARVLAEIGEIGLIHWAEDDSRRLAVWSNSGSESEVKRVAEAVASRLGWRFVADNAA